MGDCGIVGDRFLYLMFTASSLQVCAAAGSFIDFIGSECDSKLPSLPCILQYSIQFQFNFARLLIDIYQYVWQELFSLTNLIKANRHCLRGHLVLCMFMSG